MLPPRRLAQAEDGASKAVPAVPRATFFDACMIVLETWLALPLKAARRQVGLRFGAASAAIGKLRRILVGDST